MIIFQKLSHFIIQYKKSHSLILPPISSENIEVLQNFQAQGRRLEFSEILISA